MSASQGTLRVCQGDQEVTFRVEGMARLGQGQALRRHGEQALAAGARSLRVDLRHCAYMDSTFLGTLLCLKKAVDRRGWGEFALVSPGEACLRLLRTMGLDRVYPVVAADEPAGTWTELGCEPEPTEDCKRTVVQAHEALADLAGPAGAPFRDVVRCLGEAERGRNAP